MSDNRIGKRICILGLSSTGKSTLAELIARKKELPLLHLDQIYHRPKPNGKQDRQKILKEI